MTTAHRPALDQVTVSVTDLPRAFDFYQRLGLHPVVRSDHYARFIAPGNEATFSLHLAESVESTTVVYFQLDDLDGFVAGLSERGLQIDQAPRDQAWQWREAYLNDPDGNRICLYHAGRIRTNPDWRLPESRNAHPLSREEFGEWLDAYKDAWQARDPERAAALFSDDASYFETPFDEPARGRPGILHYWQAVPEHQRDVRFDYRIIHFQDGVGFNHWRATFTRQESGDEVALDGIFEVHLNGEGRCTLFREWWHRRE